MNYEDKKILAVDDNAMNLIMIKGVLSSQYKVYPVNSGATAFKFLEKQTPDLILLDMEMPEMSGIEVLREIKADPKLSCIPVIFLTGNNDTKTEAEALELGAADYMRKPVNDIVLLHRVKMQLELSYLRKLAGTE